MRKLQVKFTADLHSCINHVCSALIEVDADGSPVECLEWSDGHSTYTDMPDKTWRSLCESYEEMRGQ